MDPIITELFEVVVGAGAASMDDGNNSENLGNTSPEPVNLGAVDMTSDGDDNSENISSNNNTMMLEVVEEVAGHLAAAFQVSNAIDILEMQGGDDSHVSIDMPPHQQAPSRLPLHHVQLSKAIWTISVLTLVLDIRAALYKPATGVLFSDNQIAYYMLLSGIFALGLGEATMALWVSRPGSSQRCLSFGRAVLCASFLPFFVVLSIAGFGHINN